MAEICSEKDEVESKLTPRLRAESSKDRQCMLDIFSLEADELDLRFNVKKSLIMRIGQRFKNWCAPLVLSNDQLHYTNQMKYLGVIIKVAEFLIFLWLN
jgi:hypothetical protein